MKEVFKDLVEIEGVYGAVVLDAAGIMIASRFSDRHQEMASAIKKYSWESLVLEMVEARDMKEADFVFDNGRIFLRKLPGGFLVVVISDIAPISMVRLHCDVLMPELAVQPNAGGRIGRIFKRKIF